LGRLHPIPALKAFAGFPPQHGLACGDCLKEPVLSPVSVRSVFGYLPIVVISLTWGRDAAMLGW